jgi:hypothetical protein
MRHTYYILTAILLLSAQTGYGQRDFDHELANETITGEWILYPNTEKDTLNFVRKESLEKLGLKPNDLNPLKRWTFNADHSGQTYDEFSNFNTVNGIKTHDDEKLIKTEVVNDSTIYETVISRLSGCSYTEAQWKISKGALLTLNGNTQEYKIITLTDKRLAVIPLNEP